MSENEVAKEITLGEKRVRTSFNPSSSNPVEQIKQEIASLIDKMELEKAINPSGEKARLCSLAQTSLEEAAMWAVKAITS